MPLNTVCKNIITLVQKDGNQINDIKASVQKGLIVIPRNDIVIEAGDFIHQELSTGAKVTYEVIDPNFIEKVDNIIPAHYQIEVKKLGIPEAKKAIDSITYNISGNNNRVNQNSTDNSVNIVKINTEINNHINNLKSEINSLDISQEKKTKHIEVVSEVEKQLATENPNKTVIKSLLSTLPTVANVATIVSLITSLI